MQAAQKIRIALENAIVDGHFAPGTKLDLDEIASNFKCSRTPVREALQALETSGLLQVQPKRGTFVARLGASELVNRFEVMAEMEALCARLACRRALVADRDAIAASMRACEKAAKAADVDTYYIENTHFHRAIYSAAHNEFLEQETRRLQVMLQPYRRRQLETPGRLERSLSEHERIFAAINAGDDAAADEVMKAHVFVQGESFRDLLAMLEE